MKQRLNDDLGPLLADAGLLMFEYDADGFVVRAIGSCLGGSDPMLEVRSGLVSPEVVRRAAAGRSVTVQIAVGRRRISVKHEPVRGAGGRVERIVATAIDVTKARARARGVPALIRSLPSAS
ncbi:MAG: hypothetical protein A3H36_09460 [Chloroflexi bacterium RIFCSPLOWO2_02_FULL_71_16]|nr:MAG: hypothetical protein A3H36_09460 [Chloroflexi bacterium RIFCSPLOWO2_02_FULL_71_16]